MKVEIIKAEDYGLETKKANELTVGLKVVKDERELLVKEFEEVSKLELIQENLPKFKELRLKIVKNRTQGINKWHKANKEFFLTGGKFVDAIKNKENAINEQMEEKLMNAEKHFENLEKERISKLQNERVSLLSEFVDDANERDLSSMDSDIWEIYLSQKKQVYLDKIEAERKAEKERLEVERLEKERIEKQRVENDRLKKEAEIREKEIEKERLELKRIEDIRLEKERSEIESRRKKEISEKANRDAILQKERDEKDKLASELRAKQVEEDRLICVRNEELIKAKKEADKLAKAPIKKQLNIWVDTFELPHLRTDNDKANEIKQKFESFKSWAISEIEKM